MSNEHTGHDVAKIASRVLSHGVDQVTQAELKALAASALAQAPDKAGETQGLPVAGYKPTQPAWAIDAVNGLKALEERAMRALEDLPGGGGVDQRWLAIGRTHIQLGFMAANRAIFQPGRVTLPEDNQAGLFGGSGDDMLTASDAKGG